MEISKLSTKDIIIKCFLKKKFGKNYNKKIKKDNNIPAIIYNNKVNIPIILSYKDILLVLKNNNTFKNIIIKIELNNDIIETIIHKVQKHPVTGKIIHIDFLKIKKNNNYVFAVPICYKNQENIKDYNLIKDKILYKIHYVNIISSAYNIPKNIPVDLSLLNKKSYIALGDIILPSDIILYKKNINSRNKIVIKK